MDVKYFTDRSMTIRRNIYVALKALQAKIRIVTENVGDQQSS